MGNVWPLSDSGQSGGSRSVSADEEAHDPDIDMPQGEGASPWLPPRVYITSPAGPRGRKDRCADSTGSRILVQVTIYRRLQIGRDSHLDQSEAYDIS